MSRLSQDRILTIINSKNIGAGNFLHRLIDNTLEKTQDYMFLQEPVISFGSKIYSQISLQSLYNIAKEWSAFYHVNGIEAKDVVGIFIDDNINYFIQYIALTSIGAVPAFVNSKLSCDVAARYLNRLEAAMVVSDNKRLQLMEGIFDIISYHPQVFDLAELVKLEPKVGLPKVYPFVHHSSDPVLLTHTSGTTGIPKAVIQAHNSYLYGIKYRLENPISHIERYLSALPHSHNSGIAYLIEATMRGCPIYVQSDKSPNAMAIAIEHFKADFVIAFPKIFVEMCRAKVDANKLTSVFYWRSTGDAAHERHVREITRWGKHEDKGIIKPGSIYIDGLGSSEMGSSLFTAFHTMEKRDYNRCVGKPQPWVDAVVLDDAGNPAARGFIGRLGIKSPSLTTGYWNNTGLTEKFKCRGYWITGDLAYKDSQGNFYHVDRITDKINTPSGTIYSLQTEEFIMKKFNEIFDCSVYADVTPNGIPCASIRVDLIKPIWTEKTLIDLLKKINQELKESEFLTLNSISTVKIEKPYAPEGVTGKVLKRELRKNDHSQIKVDLV